MDKNILVHLCLSNIETDLLYSVAMFSSTLWAHMSLPVKD